MATREIDATTTNASACPAVRSSVSSSLESLAAGVRPGSAHPAALCEAAACSAACARSLAVASHVAVTTAKTPSAQMHSTDGSTAIRARSDACTREPRAAAASSESASDRRTYTAGIMSSIVYCSPRFITIGSSGRQHTLSASPLDTTSESRTPATAHSPDAHVSAPPHSCEKAPSRCAVATGEAISPAACTWKVAWPQSTEHGSVSAYELLTFTYAAPSVLYTATSVAPARIAAATLSPKLQPPRATRSAKGGAPGTIIPAGICTSLQPSAGSATTSWSSVPLKPLPLLLSACGSGTALARDASTSKPGSVGPAGTCNTKSATAGCASALGRPPMNAKTAAASSC
mmetsp:Transcript_3776/g.9800  ORF Transcript_3776/g.9800 Transcript_3776/m.9800 type:complete len:346 (-) Transcript_3776:41-1078(-)